MNTCAHPQKLSNTWPVFIHCNEKQGEGSNREECCAARITAPKPTQTQCVTNTGSNESQQHQHNHCRLPFCSSSAPPPPPSSSSYRTQKGEKVEFQMTNIFILFFILNNYQQHGNANFLPLYWRLSGERRAVCTRGNAVGKSHYTSYIETLQREPEVSGQCHGFPVQLHRVWTLLLGQYCLRTSVERLQCY